MQRCPCCHARLRELTVCSRCKTDLSQLFRIEQSAQFWLAQAIHLYLADKLELCSSALIMSLKLKKTELAAVFREFILQQEAEVLLDLLAQKKLLLARKKLYCMRFLVPYSQRLQQISAFNDYLLAREISQS